MIYSFRSSDIKIINDFKESCDEVISLKQNYRSCSNILDCANKLISNNTYVEDNDIFSLIPKKYDVNKTIYQSTIEEANVVALKIEKLLKLGIKPLDIAVLYRNNYQSNQLEMALKKRQIPYVVYGKNPFNELPECKRMISAYRFLKNPNDYLLFLLMLNPKKEELDNFKNNYHHDKPILEYAKTYPDSKINNIANNLMDLMNSINDYTKSDRFDRIAEILFGNDIKTSQSENLLLLKELITSSELEDESEILNDILIEEPSKDKALGVRLLTIHKAKGLEFKCVFLISLNDGIIPNNTTNRDSLEEERRLCYVGMTRAKEFLHVSSAYQHFISGQRKTLRPSIFMSEIN